MRVFIKRAICVLLALTFCTGLLTVLGTCAAAESLEERQQALVAVALAYFDKGHSAQYDGAKIVDEIERREGGKTRSTNQVPPEYATPHETMYTVCSDYCHQVYWETFRYQLNKRAGSYTTHVNHRVKPGDPMFVYEWTSSSGKDFKQSMTEMFDLAQPGDIITTMSSAGHSMLYVGDIYGDGVKYIAHSYGGSIKTESGRDGREYSMGDPTIDLRYNQLVYTDNNGGTIRLTPNPLEHFLKEYTKQKKINIIRPLNAIKEAEYPITTATKYRMTHPRLAIDRIVEEKSRFLTTKPGDTLTLSVKLSNNSDKAYTVPVTEKIPAGVTLKKSPDGCKVDGSTITWDAELPAKSEKTFSFSYEVTAKRGEQIIFDGGSVGDIPSNYIPITVGGKKLTKEEETKLAAVANGDYDKVLKGVKDADLGTVIYRKVLGLNVELPTIKQVKENLLELKTFSDGKATAYVFKDRAALTGEAKKVDSFLVPTLHGGLNLWNEWGIERCNDPKDADLEPGDIIVRSLNIRAEDPQTDTLVYLGGGKYLQYNPQRDNYPIVEEPDYVGSLLKSAFYCIRPTLAYDDIHTLAGTPVAAKPYKLPFTDVKESDWYFSFVRDLVRDGTVNGMTETTFAPNGNLTYGQALKLIVLANNLPEPEKSGKHWASGYLELAKKNKWVTENVDLDAKITRVQFCQIAAKSKGMTSQPKNNPFTDTTDKSVLSLYKGGIINGMTETTFAPDALLTRAQISKIILRLRLRK